MIICLEGAYLGGVALLVRPRTDWSAFQSCRTCLAPMGGPCVALNGRVAGGRPDGVPVELERPHVSRRRRSRR